MTNQERNQWISVNMPIAFDNRQTFEHDLGNSYSGYGKITSINDGLATIEVTELHYSTFDMFELHDLEFEVPLEKILITTSAKVLRLDQWHLVTDTLDTVISTNQMKSMTDEEIIDLKKSSNSYVLYVNHIHEYNEWK